MSIQAQSLYSAYPAQMPRATRQPKRQSTAQNRSIQTQQPDRNKKGKYETAAKIVAFGSFIGGLLVKNIYLSVGLMVAGAAATYYTLKDKKDMSTSEKIFHMLLF